MCDLLTWEEIVEPGIRLTTYIPKSLDTVQVVLQALADSPCPVCVGCGKVILHVQKNGDTLIVYTTGLPCPHCGDYPPDRKGKFAKDPEHALELVHEKLTRTRLTQEPYPEEQRYDAEEPTSQTPLNIIATPTDRIKIERAAEAALKEKP